MSGRGKGFKNYGKKSLSQRHRHAVRDPLMGIGKPGMRRLARRAGVKRICGSVYNASRVIAKDFLNAILRDAVTYSDHANRKTVTTTDVLYALKHNGRTLYF